ncbi:hypothetical protein [Microbacterium halotolerans]|uniref:hypothetical protein n=1 Tax=Microbacterium halotolerans TaxID=246613 RepID=UPI000E6AD9C8|nr:hypothetical protein [Microbacterium halotolerans]
MNNLDEFRAQVIFNIAVHDIPIDVTDTQGEMPVVVALDDERASVLMQRVQAVGGSATVFTRGESHVRMFVVIDERCALGSDGADDMTGTERPSPNATVGMLLDYLGQRPEGIRIPSKLEPETRRASLSQPRDVAFA